jgi:hypothetical protein
MFLRVKTDWWPYEGKVAPPPTAAEIEAETQSWLRERERMLAGNYTPPDPNAGRALTEFDPYRNERDD